MTSATASPNIISLGIYDVTNSTYIASANSGTAINNTSGADISGSAIITATASLEIQIRNSTASSISTVLDNGFSANITIVRIN